MNIVKYVTILVACFAISSCRKFGCPSYTSDDPVPSPYQDPVFHPKGNIIGFNHQVVKSAGYDKCDEKSYYSSYPDSSGFWLIDIDGTNMRRVTTFQLLDPAWSPDGKWIAFANGGVIYKMPFDGVNFDTTQVTALTDNVFNHFFPSWSPTGDSIYYDSNRDAPEHTSFYSIWKIAADGGGQTRITDTAVAVSNGDARHPVCTPNNRILYYQYPKGTEQMQIYIMDSDGHNIYQITNSVNDFIYYLGYFNGRVFYEGFDIRSCNLDGSGTKKIAINSSQGFSISKDGIVAYVNFDGKLVDKTHGTIWLTDINGNNLKPLTYNNY